jgi:Zn-dependent M28 family amino/carboxypeptidase
MDRAALEGWITVDAANRLFDAAGMDYESMKAAALEEDFQAQPLSDLTASADINNTIKRNSSQNVMGIVEGRENPEEVVMYTAHWDHLGRGPADETGDGIFNGAVDNATGMAALYEIAEAFDAMPEQPKRTVAFLAVGAEEQGLLGSAYYAANPRWPHWNHVAAINIDGMNVYGPTEDIALVGYGASELDDVIKAEAGEKGMTVVPESEPEKGFYYRSDHFSFAKVGIPALYTDGGVVHLEKPADYIPSKRAEYTREHYHKPSDEWSPAWDFRGAQQEARLLFQVGEEIANSDMRPQWSEGAEFKAIRQASQPEG